MRGTLLRSAAPPRILSAIRRRRAKGIDEHQFIFLDGLHGMAQHTQDRLDVLAVRPHPDDLEIPCGGTLAKLVRQGYRVGLLDLTSGEPTPRGSDEARAREAEAARQALGVPLRLNAGLPNRELMDVPANRYVLATL